MLTIDVLQADVLIALILTPIMLLVLAGAASLSLAHFLSLQTELKPVRVRNCDRTVHRR